MTSTTRCCLVKRAFPPCLSVTIHEAQSQLKSARLDQGCQRDGYIVTLLIQKLKKQKTNLMAPLELGMRFFQGGSI